MSREQYRHERLEWDGNHTALADMLVSVGVIVSAMILLAIAL